MERPPLGSIYIYILLALAGFMVADLVIITYRDMFLPKQAPPERPPQTQTFAQATRDSYNVITSRNLFNPDGQIPPPVSAGKDGPQGPAEDDAAPVPTQISGIQLIGTIVHSDARKSVASVKLPSSGEIVGAYKVGQTMDGVGEVLGVLRGKVIFRNAASRRKEYVELPQDARINLGVSSGKGNTGPRQDGEVTVFSETDRSMSRADVNRLTSNLPELLTQARAVPDGDCFRVLEIMPGSIYERLGIRKGDCIRSANGELVDSPAKAMQIYNALKNESSISIGIERNGRSETLNFSIQ